MRIAICDDTVDEINAIKNIIDSYKSDFEITYDCFTSGVEFLSKVSLGEFYDLIFLDFLHSLNILVAASRAPRFSH